MKKAIEQNKQIVIKKIKDEQELKRRQYVVICNTNEWRSITSDIIELTVLSNCCNDDYLTSIDFSQFTNLKRVHIGDNCFEHVKDVNFSNMSFLKSIKIGNSCFESSVHVTFMSMI